MVATLKCNPEVRNTTDCQNQQPDLMYSDITEQRVEDSKGDMINILPFPSPLPILFCSFLKGEKYGPALSLTERASRETVEEYRSSIYSISNLLTRWFSSDMFTCFKELQHQEGLVVAGSAALDFFSHTYYTDTCLDLYVTFTHWQPVALFLNDAGYSAITVNGASCDGVIPNVEALERLLDSHRMQKCQDTDWKQRSTEKSMCQSVCGIIVFLDKYQRNISLNLCVYSPFDAILSFHSTLVMNFISYSSAVSLYPRLTFEKGMATKSSPIHDQSIIEKYINRGWKFTNSAVDYDSIWPLRFVGDRRCWVIQFNEKEPMDIMWANSWRMGPTPKNRKFLGMVQMIRDIVATNLSNQDPSFTCQSVEIARLLAIPHSRSWRTVNQQWCGLIF
ncbi:hypothetical protein ARMGADRAFT_1037186 [Armillaria gallica]|uniref:Uncharacterized protein n=1 Tax=Armillaria gallica TaxID=47427 RepID=A0A2H3CZ58_ARMGA|nr:hypothetical protein ARMGADRAFT_1037186 [Armillaria gallica]